MPEPEQLPPLGAEPSAAPAEERQGDDAFDPAEMTVRLGAPDPVPAAEPLPETPAAEHAEPSGPPGPSAYTEPSEPSVSSGSAVRADEEEDGEDDEFESTVRLQPGAAAPDSATVRLGAGPRDSALAERLGEAAPPADAAAPPAPAEEAPQQWEQAPAAAPEAPQWDASAAYAESGAQPAQQWERPSDEAEQWGPAAPAEAPQPAPQQWEQAPEVPQWDASAAYAESGAQPAQQWEQPPAEAVRPAAETGGHSPYQWDQAPAEAAQPAAETGGQAGYQWEQAPPAPAEASQEWQQSAAPAAAEPSDQWRQWEQAAPAPAQEQAWWDPSAAPAQPQPSAAESGGQQPYQWDQAPAEAAQPAAESGGRQPYQWDQAQPQAEAARPAAETGGQSPYQWDQVLAGTEQPAPQAAPAPQQWERPADQGWAQQAPYQPQYPATGGQQPYPQQGQPPQAQQPQMQPVQQPYEQPPVPQGPEDLDTAALVRGGGARKNKPGKGWRKAVHAMSLGLVNPGESAADKRRNELVARARTHVAGGHHRVAVLSLKGGVGKTTTTVALGSMLASLRGDRVLAVDANPDRGTLSDKVRLETAATIRDLLNEQHMITRYADIRGFTSQAMSRLEILASDRDPAVSEAFSESDYREVSRLLEHYYSICLTDCGTGLLHSAMRGVLGLADQVVLVSSPSVDGARSASATLDWLEAHEYGYLVRGAVVVLSMVRPSGKSSVDLDRLEQHFASRCRAVVRVPWDSHLEEGAEVDLDRLAPGTRDSYLKLAATVGEAFAWPR
ncbi:MinD/ParA family ATP-binding protein [Nocardiopsis potens]|uniref:MinD/ParA family ATP-binding protein n=1 Tax=Nocardiopsis potens TaxID=1246458 RepID=UPI001F4D027A|nr:MinD/ParA family protein [Nocardiopsis potens]